MGTDVVDAHDMGALEARQDPGLAVEPGAEIGPRSEGRGHDLDRDVPVEPRVEGLPHLAHPA